MDQLIVSHNKPTRLESIKMTCIVDINHKVAGYPQSALTTMGNHPNPHVATYISIVQSNTFPMSLRIRHVFRYKTTTSTACLITIPLTAFIDKPRINYYASNADEQRTRLFPGGDKDITFRSSMRLVVNVKTSEIWRRRVGAPPADDTTNAKTLLDDWWNNVRQDIDYLEFGFSMSPNQIMLSSFMHPAIEEFARIQGNPERAWESARAFFRDPENPKQLGWKTLNIDRPRPEKPNAPQIAFTSNVARLLAMQMSSYEELEIELSNAAKLNALTFQSVFLPDVTSAWSPEDGDSFGIQSDGTIQSYIVIITSISVSDEHRSFLPQVGQSLKLSVDIPVPAPRIHPEDEDRPRMPTARALRRLMAEAEQLNREAGHTSSETTDEEVKKQAFETRDYALAFRLASVFPTPVPAELRVSQGLPDAIPDDQARIICATGLLPKFFPVRGDSEAWEDELMAAITFDLSMPSLDLSPPLWSGRPSRGGMAALIHPPPMRYEFPAIDLSGSWDKVINASGKEDTQISITISTDPNNATTRAEMAAMTTMAQAKPDTFQGKLWDYTATFDIKSSIDVTTTLPLQEFRPDGPGSPCQTMYDALRSLPAGLLAYTGGPGSGKTTFGLQIVRHITAKKPDAHIVWTVHSNELCDDIASKLRRVIGNTARIARVYPMRRMVQAIAGRHARDAVKPAGTTKLPQTAAGIATAIENHTRQRARDDPTTRADSLVSRALLTAEASPGFADVIQLRAKPVLTIDEDAALTDSIYRLIAAALETVNIIVGTPVALSQLGNCSKLVSEEFGKWNSDVIVIDEAARMPEAQAWIPIAAFDTKLVIMMGDTRQFKPMSKSLDNQGQGTEGAKWRSTFGPQRTMSLLRRAEKAGATVHHVRINRRNIGNIAAWARWNVYNGRMNIKYGKGPLVDLFRLTINNILRLDKSTANSYVVNIGEGEERNTKPSYDNEANRNYCFHLIFRLFRTGFPCTTDVQAQGSIMVITPYSAQLAAYLNEWDNYNVDAYMKQNVSFRTIDDSMSAEADVVILDTVRTEKLGFIPMTPRMGVATTRARGGMITLLNVKDWSKKKASLASFAKVNHMVSYFNWHFQHGAVADTNFRRKGWALMCTKCGGPNHLEDKCKSDNKCRNRGCGGTHDARFCPRGFRCRPEYKLRTDKPEAKPTDSITPGPVAKTETGRLHPTARRTRAQILANAVVDLDPAPAKTTDVRQDMHRVYQAVSAIKDAEGIDFLAAGHGQDTAGFRIENATGPLVNIGDVLGTEEGRDGDDSNGNGDGGEEDDGSGFNYWQGNDGDVAW
ncbi:DNA-binding protein SMUBP-2 [Colletotrichum liriopes]|uniref:DNA-binding protein SMUBP-2 n=1 Tax=Colletotrichum liriopes TaxID=708192 RepID=A0AA37LUG1_9PEZI|nr:DNA-binding protein SMUBP-2 [Colletotrichum liriopes]